MPHSKLLAYARYLEEFADSTLTIALEYDKGDVIFMGRTEAGNAKSDSHWQIKKFTYDGKDLTDIQWAGGDGNFSRIWDDRDTYIYS